MKNIFLISTDKPSRLYISINGGLYLHKEPVIDIDIRGKNQNIYITSDEEIKEGDWFIQVNTKKRIKHHSKNGLLLQPQSFDKKIILTTDQDLDGVQAIDDEFLEWFVKNPSCEKVDLDTFSMGDKILYNVVFPKEEPKDVILGYKTSIEAQMLDKVEPKQEKTFEDVLDESLAKGKAILEELKTINAKQETLEEAAEKYARKQCDDMYDNQGLTGASWGWETSLDFIAGAKWMQERMYSEKDMNDYAEYCIDIVLAQNCVYPVTPKEWFKQFKKK
jgi:hypothetical protein